MTQTLDTGLPPGIDLSASYTIRFTAVDPTTGALVAGVSVANATLLVDNLGGGDLETSLFDVEPLFTPLPANLFAPEPA